ncbi:MAG: class IV adenylate cyclase [Candidatus Eremiobacteraeota bacterium]|nr:class IV adenylate cyclase [Candidatus Eremiobacteraeota bacterium]
MKVLNIEIKVKSSDADSVRKLLLSRNARFAGEDHQVDTYFNVPKGRLKLREGTIENKLIYYERDDKSDPKESRIILYNPTPGSSLKDILTSSLGIKVVVDKKREIYFIDNVKFHIDSVAELGSYVEIEAISEEGKIGRDTLVKQCNEYMRLFGIPDADLVHCSYSDLLLEKKRQQ